MKIKSPLCSKEYLSALKSRKGHSYADLAKLSVHTVGSCFSITRSVWVSGINVKDHTIIHSATGYVRNTEDGCNVCFIRTTGYLHPLVILLLFPACILLFVLFAFFSDDPILPLNYLLLGSGILCIYLLFRILRDAFSQLFYEDDVETSKELLAILLDPKDPFSYLNNQNKLK